MRIVLLLKPRNQIGYKNRSYGFNPYTQKEVKMDSTLVRRDSDEFRSFISALEGLLQRCVRLKEKLERENPEINNINPESFRVVADKSPELHDELVFWLGKAYREVSNLKRIGNKSELRLPVEVLTDVVHLRIPQEAKTQLRYYFCTYALTEVEGFLKDPTAECRDFYESFISNVEAILDKARPR